MGPLKAVSGSGRSGRGPGVTDIVAKQCLRRGEKSVHCARPAGQICGFRGMRKPFAAIVAITVLVLALAIVIVAAIVASIVLVFVLVIFAIALVAAATSSSSRSARPVFCSPNGTGQPASS